MSRSLSFKSLLRLPDVVFAAKISFMPRQCDSATSYLCFFIISSSRLSKHLLKWAESLGSNPALWRTLSGNRPASWICWISDSATIQLRLVVSLISGPICEHWVSAVLSESMISSNSSLSWKNPEVEGPSKVEGPHSWCSVLYRVCTLWGPPRVSLRGSSREPSKCPRRAW